MEKIGSISLKVLNYRILYGFPFIAKNEFEARVSIFNLIYNLLLKYYSSGFKLL